MKKMVLYFFLFFFANSAYANVPVPWQVTLQLPVTPLMENLWELHNILMIIITFVVLFVLVLLSYVCYRFHISKNPIPAKFSHNVTIEIIWTLIPVLLLIIIAVPSFRALYFAERIPNADLTIKVVGHQWYWSYEYPKDNFGFESYMVADKDLKPGEHRLLEVDNRIVVPVDTTIKFLITASDVIHSFAVPAFGIKTDAVPGRVNETWARISKPGVYYGQCSELCGVKHGFMPIAVEVVTKEEYERWLEGAKKKFG